MTQERQRYALLTIFSFFLGLMVVAFVGVGVNTFYPNPSKRHEPEMRRLSRAQEDIETTRGKDGQLTADQQQRLAALRTESRVIEDLLQDQMKVWARNTSIVIILFATVVMALSLVRSDQLKVVSNGLLLGGLFSMVYGTGWIIASERSTTRFVVMVFALLVTLTLGYLKFVSVRGRKASLEAAAAAGPPDRSRDRSAREELGSLDTLAARVTTLESRVEAAAAALTAAERASPPSDD